MNLETLKTRGYKETSKKRNVLNFMIQSEFLKFYTNLHIVKYGIKRYLYCSNILIVKDKMNKNIL